MTVHDISIPLRFDGEQPNHFGAPAASATPLVAGGFTGAVAAGGSCECATLSLTPHCNGTHTETVRHVTGTGPAPYQALAGFAMRARLATVVPVTAPGTDETTDPPAEPGDLLVTRAALEKGVGVAWRQADGSTTPTPLALVVRTTPNDPGKRNADWTIRNAPFFTSEAMEWIVGRGVLHLLFDGPSIDRRYDEGKLTTHRIFFARREHATVTEMVYVPDAVADGDYELDLQVPAFDSDAAPSRPLLRAVTR